MIDWKKPIECDRGKVITINELSPGATVRLTDEQDDSCKYSVSTDGIPHCDLLDESFIVRNKKSVEEKTVEILEGYLKLMRHDELFDITMALRDANLLAEDK